MNNSLTKASYFENLETYKPENTVMIFNPLSSDLNAMRQTLLFGGLESIAYNVNRKSSSLRLFEFGKAYTFHKKEGENHLKQYQEEDKLSLFITGNKTTQSWNSREEKTDFFNIKAYCEMILTRLGTESRQPVRFRLRRRHLPGRTDLFPKWETHCNVGDVKCKSTENHRCGTRCVLR